MNTEHRVASFDGTKIAYKRWGEPTDRVPLVFCSGIACDDIYWTRLAPKLGRERLVITWDYPFHGGSGAAGDPEAIGVPSLARHGLTVMDDAAVGRAVLAGHSMGVQVLLEMYRLAPSRLAGMIPIAGPFAHTVGSFYGTSVGLPILTAVELATKLQPDLATAVWKALATPRLAEAIGRTSGLIGASAPSEVMHHYFEHLGRMDLPKLTAMFRAGQEHSAEDLLEQIDVPVLILHGTSDMMSPIVWAEKMAERVPGAELVAVEGGAHTLPVEDDELLVREISRFLSARVDGGEDPGALD